MSLLTNTKLPPLFGLNRLHTWHTLLRLGDDLQDRTPDYDKQEERQHDRTDAFEIEIIEI